MGNSTINLPLSVNFPVLSKVGWKMQMTYFMDFSFFLPMMPLVRNEAPDLEDC